MADKTPFPPGATIADGERALASADEIIATLKRAHEAALDRAARQVWFDFIDAGLQDTLHAIATFRQSLSCAQLVRERIATWLAALKENNAG